MLQFGKSNTYTVGAHIHMAMHQARHWYHLDPNSSCASTQLASLLRSAWQGARLSPRPPLALPPLLPPALGRLSAASSLPALFLPPPPALAAMPRGLVLLAPSLPSARSRLPLIRRAVDTPTATTTAAGSMRIIGVVRVWSKQTQEEV